MENKFFKRQTLPVIEMDTSEGKILTPCGQMRLILKDEASGKIYVVGRTPRGGLQMIGAEST